MSARGVWALRIAALTALGWTIVLAVGAEAPAATGEVADRASAPRSQAVSEVLPTLAEETERELLAAARAATDLPQVTVDYPENGSIFPPDMIAPTFLWHDDAGGAERWLVEFDFRDGNPALRFVVPGADPPRGTIDPRCISTTNEIYEPTPYQASARAWRPRPAVWEEIKLRSVAEPVAVRILGLDGADPPRVVSGGSSTLRTAVEPVGAPIFYRDVPLMPSETEEGVIKPLDQSAVPLIDWRLRSVAHPDSRIMLRDMPTCANCHSFSADGKTLGMDVDGPQGDKGAYAVVALERRTVIRDTDVMTWNAYEKKTPGLNTLGFLSRISPDGRYAIATVNEALFVRNFWDYRFGQVFFPTRGILAVYDRETGSIRELPGADDPAYVHCNPVWTPDGRSIVFSRAEAKDPYDLSKPQATYSGDPNETQIRYDLYRIPFEGGRGGTAVPIAGASSNGMSNSFPKVSPDGKWLVWVQSANGQLMRPDSTLWIVPLAGGKPRRMRCNVERMNSWHSFSPNGSWMVFTSKTNTPYTQMFLTHLDEHGNDSPAILIPESTAANRAVNLPEFVNVAWEDFESISVPAVDHYLHFQRGNELARAGRHTEALVAFERALEGEKKDWRVNDWRIHDSLSKTLLQLGDRQAALEHTRSSLALNPYNAEMQANAGYLLFELGQPGQALEHLDIALRLVPRDPRLWYNRGSMRLRLGDRSGALEDYTEAIRRSKSYADAWAARGAALLEEGDAEAAVADLDRAVELDPDDPSWRYLRARARHALGNDTGALGDLDHALAIAPADWPQRGELQSLRLLLRRDTPLR